MAQASTASSTEHFGHLDKLIVQFSAELVSSPNTPFASPRTSAAASPNVAAKRPGNRTSDGYTASNSPAAPLRSSFRSRSGSAFRKELRQKSVEWDIEGRQGEVQNTGEMPAPTPAGVSTEATQNLDNLMADIESLGLEEAPAAEDSKTESQHQSFAATTPPTVQPPVSPKTRRRATSVGKRQTKGANTAATEICPYCDDAIGGYFSVKALGRYWHADHLRCHLCDKVLGTATFFHKELNLFCGDCWTDHYSPRCEFCHEAILESCIEALGKNWHPEHFFCSQCGKKIGNGEPFMEHQSKAYCEEDYFALFSPLCIKCEKAITTEFVEALGRKWHPNCFTCRTCNKTLSNGTFFELHGHGYCESHYHEAKGSICAGCSKPIAGRCLNVMGKKYHTEHFTCAFCMCALEKAAFKEGAGEKPYCVPCHTRLFG